MANLIPPIPNDRLSETHVWREWFYNLGNYIQQAQVGNTPWTVVQGGTGGAGISGYVKGTGTSPFTGQTGVPTSDLTGTLAGSTMPALTGDISSTVGTVVTTLGNGVVTTVKIADLNVTTAKIAQGAIINAKLKNGALVALSDAAATLTAAQMIDSSVFTITPTVARILTTDTGTAIVAAIPGAVTGTKFEIVIVNTAAFDVTLAPGVGVTMGAGQGKHIINNVSGSWIGLVTSATTVTIYRK